MAKRIYLDKIADGITFTNHSVVSYLGIALAQRGAVPRLSVSVPIQNVSVSINDSNVLQAYHNILLPKAVEYSAGLLDYFFRGQIEVGAHVDSGEYTVNVFNFSSQPFSGGSFYLYKEDSSSGNRSLVQQTDLVGILPPGEHIQFIYDDNSLSGPTKFILVYKGTIGADGGQPLDPVDANIGIAAQIFNLDPIQGCILCGGCNFWPCVD